MGLLDDAIREHLELRRRHGADAALVAREEHDALGDSGDAVGTADESYGTVGEAAHDHIDDGAGPASGSVGQETVELDMADVLYADGGGGDHEPGDGVGDSDGHGPNEDETAGLPSPIPGQERLGFG
jgi:hypothetical protein